MKTIDNFLHHNHICEELYSLYEKKNHDYGDSFHDTYIKFGPVVSAIRLTDKHNRFCNLLKSEVNSSEDEMMVDESLRDTLMDLANYAIMTIMEIDRKKNQES